MQLYLCCTPLLIKKQLQILRLLVKIWELMIRRALEWQCYWLGGWPTQQWIWEMLLWIPWSWSIQNIPQPRNLVGIFKFLLINLESQATTLRDMNMQIIVGWECSICQATTVIMYFWNHKQVVSIECIANFQLVFNELMNLLTQFGKKMVATWNCLFILLFYSCIALTLLCCCWELVTFMRKNIRERSTFVFFSWTRFLCKE